MAGTQRSGSVTASSGGHGVRTSSPRGWPTVVGTASGVDPCARRSTVISVTIIAVSTTVALLVAIVAVPIAVVVAASGTAATTTIKAHVTRSPKVITETAPTSTKG